MVPASKSLTAYPSWNIALS